MCFCVLAVTTQVQMLRASLSEASGSGVVLTASRDLLLLTSVLSLFLRNYVHSDFLARMMFLGLIVNYYLCVLI